MFEMEALLQGEGGQVTFNLWWSLNTSYIDHGHVVKQFSENNEMAFVTHFKRSCGTSTIELVSVVQALQGEKDFLIVLHGVLPTPLIVIIPFCQQFYFGMI